MITIDHIFIIHFKPLVDRKLYLDKYLYSIKIPYTYITSDPIQDKQLYQNNIEYEYKPTVYNRFLSKGEICASIQHFNAYKHILNKEINNALIIEDDAIFADNFFLNLYKVCGNLSKDFDMCFISECCNLHAAQIDPNKLLYKSSTSRCVTGYIVNSKCLSYILSSLPFQYPIDWHLNMINQHNELNFYWSEPCLIKQGSEFFYRSNLR